LDFLTFVDSFHASRSSMKRRISRIVVALVMVAIASGRCERNPQSDQ